MHTDYLYISMNVLFFTAAYILLVTILRNFKHVAKPEKLVTNWFSMAILYFFLNTGDLTLLVSYYLYDLARCLYQRDVLFTCHHLATLYMLFLPADHPDYAKVAMYTYFIKRSDVFLHWHNILSSIVWSVNLAPTIKVVELAATLATIVLWLYDRIARGCCLYPMSAWETNLIVAGLHVASAWWILKLAQLTVRLTYEAAALELTREEAVERDYADSDSDSDYDVEDSHLD